MKNLEIKPEKVGREIQIFSFEKREENFILSPVALLFHKKEDYDKKYLKNLKNKTNLSM